MSARRRTATLGAVVALVLATAACQGGDEEPTAEPTTPAAESADPAPDASSDPSPDEVVPDETADPDDEGADDGADGDDSGGTTNGDNTVFSPEPNETVDGPEVTVRGEGTAFEGTLLYEVMRPETDEVVAHDFVQAGANGTVEPFEFTVELEPGFYTVRVWEPDASDGEGEQGPFINLVEVPFTVE